MERKYAYYANGVYTSDIILGKDSISHRSRDKKSLDWFEFSTLEKDTPEYNLPTYILLNTLAELEKLDWTNPDNKAMPDASEYTRYQKLEAIIDGNKKVAWIWASYNTKTPAIDIITEDNNIIGFIMNYMDKNFILIEQGKEELSPLKLWMDPILSPASYGIKHLGKLEVPMRDGVRLATDVWIPSNLPEGAKVPAVFHRTPYSTDLLGIGFINYVNRGYAFVCQETRGRWHSEGEWTPFIHEAEDGEDTLKWIAEQPWSDQKVGMIGASYAGYAQWAAAGTGSTFLKALVSQVTSGSPYFDIPRRGGGLINMMAWVFMMAEKIVNPAAVHRDDWDSLLKTTPVAGLPKEALGKDIEFYNKWIGHSDYDEFWEKCDWTTKASNINVPALIISGWYDDDSNGTSEAWELMKKYNRPDQKMIIGPWQHNYNQKRGFYSLSFGKDAIKYDLGIQCLKWFDHYLKGIDNGISSGKPVEFYLMGKNEWIKTNEFSPENTEITNFYFHSDGNANSSKGAGLLSTEKPGNEPQDIYVYDPLNPEPYIGDMSENELSSPINFKEYESREDILTYTTSMLSEDISVIGEIYSEIFAASSALDTDWIIRLTDVDEYGNSIRLSDGLLRARYRNSYAKQELLEPGKVEKYNIRLSKTGYTFVKGHRIRVSILSGSRTLVFPNTNTGKNPFNDTEAVVATQTVYHTDIYPSHIKLPVVKANKN